MEDKEKITKGLEITYQKLIEFKKYKKTPMIILKNGKIIEIPYNLLKTKKSSEI